MTDRSLAAGGLRLGGLLVVLAGTLGCHSTGSLEPTAVPTRPQVLEGATEKASRPPAMPAPSFASDPLANQPAIASPTANPRTMTPPVVQTSQIPSITVPGGDRPNPAGSAAMPLAMPSLPTSGGTLRPAQPQPSPAASTPPNITPVSMAPAPSAAPVADEGGPKPPEGPLPGTTIEPPVATTPASLLPPQPPFPMLQ